MKIVLDVFQNTIEKDIDQKALEGSVPAAVNQQLKSMNTTIQIDPNVAIYFFTSANPTIYDHELTFPVGAQLINKGQKTPITCEQI